MICNCWQYVTNFCMDWFQATSHNVHLVEIRNGRPELSRSGAKESPSRRHLLISSSTEHLSTEIILVWTLTEFLVDGARRFHFDDSYFLTICMTSSWFMMWLRPTRWGLYFALVPWKHMSFSSCCVKLHVQKVW